MKNICPICNDDPTSHSFYKITNDTFYTCPAKASKYWDTQGILKHYSLLLDEHGEKPWIWIFDCHEFEIKHLLEIEVAIGIASLLSTKDGIHLQEIKIINKTWHIQSLLTILWPFLNDHIRSIIKS